MTKTTEPVEHKQRRSKQGIQEDADHQEPLQCSGTQGKAVTSGEPAVAAGPAVVQIGCRFTQGMPCLRQGYGEQLKTAGE